MSLADGRCTSQKGTAARRPPVGALVNLNVSTTCTSGSVHAESSPRAHQSSRYGAFRYEFETTSEKFSHAVYFKVMFADNEWVKRNVSSAEETNSFYVRHLGNPTAPLVSKKIAVGLGPDNHTTVACGVARFGEFHLLEGSTQSSPIMCTLNYSNVGGSVDVPDGFPTFALARAALSAHLTAAELAAPSLAQHVGTLRAALSFNPFACERLPAPRQRVLTEHRNCTTAKPRSGHHQHHAHQRQRIPCPRGRAKPARGSLELLLSSPRCAP